MSLIQCSECGQTISNKAIKCPKCGYPLTISKDSGEAAKENKSQDVQQINNTDEIKYTLKNLDPINDISPKFKSKKKAIIFISIVIVICIIVSTYFVFTYIFQQNLTVEEINISKWKLTDSTDYGDYYEGILLTNETKPFIAVIGYYKENELPPCFVYMDDGNGILQTYESSDDDPSVEYKAIGYINGYKVDESDINNISYRDVDYYDWKYLEESSCTVDIELEFNRKLNGFLFFELRNDLTNEVEYNCSAVVIDGKIEYSYYISELPYKSRGVEVTLTPLFFCKTKKIIEENYIVNQAFKIESNKGEYNTSYVGTEVLIFDGYNDGLITYSKVLTEGGEKADRNKPVYNTSYLYNNKCTITTYDNVDNDDNILTPSYDISVIGYLSWQTIE